MDLTRNTVLLTGASGFVGGAILKEIVCRNLFNVRAILRNPAKLDGLGGNHVVFGELDAKQCWDDALKGIDIVVHSAARVHVMNETVADSLAEFRKVNVEGTLNLASQAASRGGKRFVFISSIKVNGEGTPLGRPYTAESVPAPVDAYGISKLEAEIGLLKIANETSMQVVIIRPVLVYGPGVKANFLSMMRILDRGIPLPFGRINNKRSFVALDNLVDFTCLCMTHPDAANQIFLISDGEDLSTPDLMRRLAFALGRKPMLIPIPVSLLQAIGAIFGKDKLITRLCDSLQVDITKNRDLLGWVPPLSIDTALARTAESFRGVCAR